MVVQLLRCHLLLAVQAEAMASPNSNPAHKQLACETDRLSLQMRTDCQQGRGACVYAYVCVSICCAFCAYETCAFC